MSAARPPLRPRPSESAEVAPFRCEVEPHRETVRVRPVGELEHATVPVVQEQLEELRGAGFDRIVLDLRALRFMDSSGLRLILAWSSASGAPEFALIPGPPAVQRLFETTRTAERLPFVGALTGSAGRRR